jgi:hypothetical protein
MYPLIRGEPTTQAGMSLRESISDFSYHWASKQLTPVVRKSTTGPFGMQVQSPKSRGKPAHCSTIAPSGDRKSLTFAGSVRLKQ